MKKFISIMLVGTLAFSLTACSLQEAKEIKAVTEQGMKQLEDGDYEKAINSFDQALNLGSKRDEIEDLYEILGEFLSARDAYNNSQYTEAKNILDDLDEEYRDYSTLRKDVRELKTKVEETLETGGKEVTEETLRAAKEAADAAAEAAAAAKQAAAGANAPDFGYYSPKAMDGYLYPSDTQYLTVEYLDTLPNSTVDLIRNEIYARHGYIFKTKAFADYFNSQSWYTPSVPADSFNTSVFNAVEKANIDLLVQYQGL